MFGREGIMSIEHEILKENHETLVRDYESLEERIKQVEETYDIMKKLLHSKTKELELANLRLLEDFERERTEKDKYKTLDNERKARIDELMKENQELLMAKRKREEELEKMGSKYVELADKFGVVEAECAYLKSIYDDELAASGTPRSVMSGIGDTENLIGHEENKENHNVNNKVTDAIVISDESDDEFVKPPRVSNISSQQEEERRNRADLSNENRALGNIVTPRSANHPLPFSASSSSSSSSSSDGYDVTVQLPANWPDWAIPKAPANKP